MPKEHFVMILMLGFTGCNGSDPSL